MLFLCVSKRQKIIVSQSTLRADDRCQRSDDRGTDGQAGPALRRCSLRQRSLRQAQDKQDRQDRQDERAANRQKHNPKRGHS